MKKRIISLLLVLAMALSLAFVSCKADPPPEEPTPPAPIPTETIKYLPSVQQTGGPTSTTVTNSFVLDASEASSQNQYYFSTLGGYVRNYRTSITDSANYEGAENYSYALYSEFSGQKYEFIVTRRGSFGGDYDDKTVVDYYISSENGYSWVQEGYWAGIVLTLRHADDSYTHYLFDAFLNQIDVIENEDYDVEFYVSYNSKWNSELSRTVYTGRIFFGENEYETQNFYISRDGEDYFVKKTAGDSDDEDAPAFDSSNIVYDDERQEYTYLSGRKAARFDKDGNLIFSYTLSGVPLWAELDSYWLDDGRVIFCYQTMLDKDATEYDFYDIGEGTTYKYNYKAFVFSPTDQKLTEIEDFKYIGDIVLTRNDAIKRANLSGATFYMIEPTIICDDGSLDELENTIVAFDESFKAVKYYKYPAIDSGFKTLKNGAIVYSDDYTRYLVDAEGKKIADIPLSDTEQINNKWFIDNGCVYNEKYELLYDFVAQGRELYEICDDAILLWGEVTIEDAPTTCLISWMGVNSEKVLFTEDDYYMGNANIIEGYVITEKSQENGYTTLELLTVEGTSLKKWENVEYWYYDEIAGHGCTNLELEIRTVEEIYEEDVLVETNYFTEFFVRYIRPNVIIG